MSLVKTLNLSCNASKVKLQQTHIRTSFYNRYKHGPQKISNPDPPYLQWVKDFFGSEGKQFIVDEAKRIVKKQRRMIQLRHRDKNRLYKIEDFDRDECLSRWKPVTDSDSLNGYSTSRLMRSPSGHGLFTGVLDNRVPDDGLTQFSGFAGVIGPAAPRDKIIQLDRHWDWTGFNCIEIRYRGDGRKYAIAINTSDYMNDLSYYDCYLYPLYTRGGPFWQTAVIPFSKFIFSYKGLMQDDQGAFPTYRVRFVALILNDRVNGPFALEVDYIGLRNQIMPFDELTAYEKYTFPHIKYKPLQVDCEPPEQ